MGKRKRLLLTGVLLLSLMMILLMPTLISAQDVTVSIDAPAEAAAGTTFIARVNITDVTNFDACNYDINYDPNVFNIIAVTDGLISSTPIPVGIWNELAAGRVSIVENVPGTSGVSGSGYLAELHFEIVGPYSITSEIVISNGTLGDNTATQIQATWTNDSVNVIGLPMPTETLSPSLTPTLSPTPTSVPTHNHKNGPDIAIWVWIVAGFGFVIALVVIIMLIIRRRR